MKVVRKSTVCSDRSDGKEAHAFDQIVPVRRDLVIPRVVQQVWCWEEIASLSLLYDDNTRARKLAHMTETLKC
jgi:hypothetical protein